MKKIVCIKNFNENRLHSKYFSKGNLYTVLDFGYDKVSDIIDIMHNGETFSFSKKTTRFLNFDEYFQYEFEYKLNLLLNEV